MRFLMFGLGVLLVAATPGQATADQMPLSNALVRLERRVSLLEAHQQRMERRLADGAQRITRLKAQKRGVTRDMQLRTALRASQQVADRLTQGQTKLHRARKSLRVGYRRVLKTATDAARRERARRGLLALRNPQRMPKVLIDVQADPLDSAEDLEEKADLLDDSADKLEREQRKLRRRLALLRRRYALQRHQRAADQTLFVEEATRRVGRVSSAKTAAASPQANHGTYTNAAAPTTAGPRQEYSDPVGAQAPSYDGGWRGDQAPPQPAVAKDSPQAAVELSTTLDPMVYADLRRTLDRPGASYRSLKATARKMDSLAKQLSQRAKALRANAKAIRTKKRKAAR